MFQIISTMVVELPSFLGELAQLGGMPPNVQLDSEPWDMIAMNTRNVSVSHPIERRPIFMTCLLTNGSRLIHLIRI